MKKKLSLLLCLVLLLLTGCGQIGSSIRFGAADVGGMYYPFASSYTGLVSKDNADYQFEVKTTAGSAANLRLLSGITSNLVSHRTISLMLLTAVQVFLKGTSVVATKRLLLSIRKRARSSSVPILTLRHSMICRAKP